MIENKKFKNFESFMAGYFHVDWYLDDPNYESVWKKYLEDVKEEPEHKTLLLSEVEKILNYSPKEIKDYLCECDFCLDTDQEAYDWIKSFSEYLETK